MPEDYYVITLHLRGRSQFSQGDEAIALDPNEIAIVDGMRPFRISFVEPVRRASAVIPHAMIDRLAPWLRSGSHRKIAAKSPFADLIRRHLLQLAGGALALTDTEATLLTENLCNLLALATARDMAPGSLRPELMLETVLAYCRQELNNPQLTPARVAAHFAHLGAHPAFAVPAPRSKLRPLAAGEPAGGLWQIAARSAFRQRQRV